MDINTISNLTSAYATTKTQTSTATQASSTTISSASSTDGAVYEKSSDTSYKTANAALIKQMKQDTEDRVSQLSGIVEQMMTKQGVAIGKADDIWSFLASGNYTIDEAAKKKAQDEISENGYWGVSQTSDRILDFAKALSGDDTGKADTLLAAFKKGYEKATKSWGKELPDISKKTYDAVVSKFEKWKNGTESDSITE